MSEKLAQKSDEELMQAYQRGEVAAFETLYARHSARVYGFLRSKLRDRAMADDVFQGTFLKLHDTRATYDCAFPFAPWLFTVCRSVMVDAIRKQRRVLEELDADAIDQAVVFSGAEASVPALDALSSVQRNAMELRYQHDLSFEEIAKRLETSPANVRQIVSRSVKKLRVALKSGEEK